MLVDPKHHRHFVIRRGQVLREIAEEYGGVMVSFPRSGTQSDKVTLKGAKDCVEAAKKRIQEIIEDLVSTQGLWSPLCVRESHQDCPESVPFFTCLIVFLTRPYAPSANSQLCLM